MLLMLSVAPPHTHVELRTLESVVQQNRHVFDLFKPFRTQYWWRKVREAALNVERIGLIRNDGRGRYSLNDYGFGVLHSVEVAHEQRQQLASWMISALAHQPEERTAMKQAIRDLQRGRMPRFR